MRYLIKVILSFPIILLDAIAYAYMALLARIVPNGYVPFWLDIQSRRIATRTSRTVHSNSDGNYEFTFHTPNALCQWRVDTFSSKEPETLEWIDRYGGSGTLFDIGANVGLYSVYYAKTKPGKVYAFEPSVLNLALLAKNINVNNVQKKINIVTNPLTNLNEFADFNLQVTDEGGALSSFGVDHGQDGKPFQKILSYPTCGFSLDYLIDNGIIKDRPALIKVDVDGIEHLILQGARNTLAHPECRTVLIEVLGDFEILSNEVHNILSGTGFKLSTRDQINQIWVKG